MDPTNPSATLSEAPVFEHDFYGVAARNDPARFYRSMHQCGPVIWMRENHLHAIVGFQELTSSLRKHKVFVSGKGVSIDEKVNALLIGSTLNSDPPQHDATRTITFKPLTPSALTSVREKVELEASTIVDTVCSKGAFDAAQELASHIPLTIVRDLVGLGEQGKTNMLKWGGATFELMGDPKERRSEALENMRELRGFLENPTVLASLKPDGWAKSAIERGLENGIAADRAVELMRDYIAPSLDTTISAIGFGVMSFAQFPEQWDMLRRDRTLIRNAIEEIVRLNTPIRAFTRFLASDIEVAGVKLDQGCRVLMAFGAANRDANRFPEPDSFDITRNVRGHVGFGHGVHACLGMHLARMEMDCLFQKLADRVKRFHLTDKPEISQNSTIHSFHRIPVRVELG